MNRDTYKLLLAVALLTAFTLVAAVCAPTVRGAEPPFVAVAAGEYVLILPSSKLVRLTVSADGSYELSPIAVSQLGDAPVNPPVKPPVETQLATTVTNLIAAVNDPDKPQTAKAVAMIYRSVEQIDVKTPDDLRKATDLLYRPLMSAVGKLDLWQGFKAGVDTATKDLSSLADCVAAWGVVADTLEAVQ